jgi:hypothetical protein
MATNVPDEAVGGVFTDDPLIGAQGLLLRVTTHSFEIGGFGPDNRGTLPLTAFNGTLLHMNFSDEHDLHTHGSAVLLHPGIAVTAKHVVEEWVQLIESDRASAYCTGPRQDQMLIWEVEALHVATNADLAVLVLRYRSHLPSRREFFTHKVTTRMPVKGDQVSLAGFRADERSVPKASDGFASMLCAATGTVIDVWPEGRDSVMLPSASFAVQCAAIGGMSGGPVFDKDGRLIGIVSSSFDNDDIACVSHIWPALLAPIAPVWPKPLEQAPTSLLHMGRRHAVDIHGPDAFRMEVRAGSLYFDYVPWS